MQSGTFHLDQSLDFLRDRLLFKAATADRCAVLDSHSDKGAVVPVTGIRYDLLAAYGSVASYTAGHDGLEGLQQFVNHHRGQWIFGHLGYDLKNGIEQLHSRHPNRIGFEEISFFVPEELFLVCGSTVTVLASDPEKSWQQLLALEPVWNKNKAPVLLRQRLAKADYLEAVGNTVRHIYRGDIYEMNYCHEFYAEQTVLDPVSVARELFRTSPNPFACYYRQQQSHLMCASPERFIRRSGNTLLTQPIKGTARRGRDAAEDKLLKEALQQSDKERSENIMIVDLVRNDLSRLADRASVEVVESCGVYTFAGAHQMISSVSCTVAADVRFTDILRATFPMGSMTGAPKIRAMQLIDELEPMRRGLFSGSVGYLDPSGDFDFNVVIRNIQYRSDQQYVSVTAGGAITAASDPLDEFEETLLKMRPQIQVLGGSFQQQDSVHA